MEPSPAPKRSRSGTETRKRWRPISVRLDEAEHAELEATAARARLTVGSYVRSRILATPVTKPRRRPPRDVETLTRLQGEMNKVGSNLHQLVRRVNFGETPAGDEVRAALVGYKEVVAAIMDALGRGPR